MKALALAFLLALPALADVPAPVPGVPIPREGYSHCYPQEGYCITRMDEYLMMRSCMMNALPLIEELHDKLEKAAKEPPKCATLEVVPKKPLPPLKKERDS